MDQNRPETNNFPGTLKRLSWNAGTTFMERWNDFPGTLEQPAVAKTFQNELKCLKRGLKQAKMAQNRSKMS